MSTNNKHSKLKDKNPKDNDKTDNVVINDESISVLITNLPQNLEVNDIENFLKTILKEDEFTVITKKRKGRTTPRGFAFARFNTIEAAEGFIDKEHFYEKNLLDCKILDNHKGYIEENLNLLRNPLKIYIDGVPEDLNNDELEKQMEFFGKIDDIAYTQGKQEDIKEVYITFVDSSSAKFCVKTGSKTLECGVVIEFHFARPRFSNYMIKSINPV